MKAPVGAAGTGATPEVGLDEAISLATQLASQGRSDEVEGLCRDVLGQVAPLTFGLANLLATRGRLDDAARLLGALEVLAPDDAQLHRTLAEVHLHARRYVDAEKSARRSLAIDDLAPVTHELVGRAIFKLMGPRLALPHLERATSLDPGIGRAWGHLGVARLALSDFAGAIAAFRKALELDPTDAASTSNLGSALFDTLRQDEGIRLAIRSHGLAPEVDAIASNALFLSNNMVDLDAAALRRAHVEWGREAAKRVHTDHRHANRMVPDRRVKIGYLSPDLRFHSVAYFIGALLVARDRERFHVTAYASSMISDDMTDYLRDQCDRWREVAQLSDDRTADLILEDEIDILVDLAGHTADNRLGVMARKPAPVQVTYLGYPCTTGLAAIDYAFTDAHVDPLGTSEPWSTEELLRPWPSFVCYAASPHAAPVSPLPALARDGMITFGSFNHARKITPATLDLWASFLTAVPGSRMVLKSRPLEDPSCHERLLSGFDARGVRQDRIEVWPFEGEQRDHFRRYAEIDIALDTFPYHGTTTTCEALWHGVPVVTLAGATRASRTGVSLLTNVGLPQLVAQTRDEYVAGARDLAADLERLAGLRASLRQMMDRSPIRDAVGFTRSIEGAYRQIWTRACEASRSGPQPRGSA